MSKRVRLIIAIPVLGVTLGLLIMLLTSADKTPAEPTRGRYTQVLDQLYLNIPSIIGCDTSLTKESMLNSEPRPVKEWARLEKQEFSITIDEPKGSYTLLTADYTSRFVRLAVLSKIAVPHSATEESKKPLVVFIHGLGTNPDRAFGGPRLDYLNNIGHRLASHDFIVIVPFIYNDLRWNSLASSLYPVLELNIAAIQASIDIATSKFPVDEDKIVLYGISEGADIVRRVASLDKRIELVVLNGRHNDPTGFLLEEGIDTANIDATTFPDKDPCSSSILAEYREISVPLILEYGGDDQQDFNLEKTVEILIDKDIDVIRFKGGHAINPDNTTINLIKERLGVQ